MGIKYHALCTDIIVRSGQVLCTMRSAKVVCTMCSAKVLWTKCSAQVLCTMSSAQVSCIMLCTGIMYHALFTGIMYHALCSDTHAGPPAAAWCWCPHLLTLFLLACIFFLWHRRLSAVSEDKAYWHNEFGWVAEILEHVLTLCSSLGCSLSLSLTLSLPCTHTCLAGF